MPNNIHVSYDLNSPGQDYARIMEKIKSLGSWAKILKSYWFVSTDLSANQVHAAVWSVMDPNDTLYVVDARKNEAAWKNLSPAASDHIKRNWSAQVLA